MTCSLSKGRRRQGTFFHESLKVNTQFIPVETTVVRSVAIPSKSVDTWTSDSKTHSKGLYSALSKGALPYPPVDNHVGNLLCDPHMPSTFHRAAFIHGIHSLITSSTLFYFLTTRGSWTMCTLACFCKVVLDEQGIRSYLSRGLIPFCN